MAHRLIRKAIIPVAGLGTRFLPVTKSIPKEMIPIVDRPMIQFIVEEATRAGIQEIILVTAKQKKVIEDYFHFNVDLDEHLEKSGKLDLLKQSQDSARLAKISTVIQDKPLGLGHAVGVAQTLVGSEPFAVLLGDDLIDSDKPCIGQLIDIFETHKKSVVGVMNVERKDTSKYGIVSVKPMAKGTHTVEAVVEKPKAELAPSTLAIPGRYVLTPKIFDHLKQTKPSKNGEIQLSDALDMLAKSEGLLAHEFIGTRYDTGDRLGFLEATLEFALRRNELKTDLMAIMKKQLERHQ